MLGVLPQSGPQLGAQPRPQTNVPIFPPGLDERGEDFAEDSPFNIGLAGPSPDEEIDPNAGGAIPLELRPNELNQIVPGQEQTAVQIAQGDLAGQGVGPGVPIGEMAGESGERRTAPDAYKDAALAASGMLAPVAATLAPIGAGGGMALLRALAARLGIGGGRAAAPVGRQIGTSATGRPPINVGPTKQLAGPRSSVQPPAAAAAPRPPTPSPRPAASPAGQVPATGVPRPAGTRPMPRRTLSLKGSQSGAPALLEQIAANTALGGG
jgi:hypothetical protein